MDRGNRNDPAFRLGLKITAIVLIAGALSGCPLIKTTPYYDVPDKSLGQKLPLKVGLVADRSFFGWLSPPPNYSYEFIYWRTRRGQEQAVAVATGRAMTSAVSRSLKRLFDHVEFVDSEVRDGRFDLLVRPRIWHQSAGGIEEDQRFEADIQFNVEVIGPQDSFESILLVGHGQYEPYETILDSLRRIVMWPYWLMINGPLGFTSSLSSAPQSQTGQITVGRSRSDSCAEAFSKAGSQALEQLDERIRTSAPVARALEEKNRGSSIEESR